MLITRLVQSTNGRLYIYLKDDQTCDRFLRDAENEGVTFGDGEKPTSRPHDCIYAVNRNKTINFVGYVGHVAVGCHTDEIGGQKLVVFNY